MLCLPAALQCEQPRLPGDSVSVAGISVEETGDEFAVAIRMENQSNDRTFFLAGATMLRYDYDFATRQLVVVLDDPDPALDGAIRTLSDPPPPTLVAIAPRGMQEIVVRLPKRTVGIVPRSGLLAGEIVEIGVLREVSCGVTVRDSPFYLIPGESRERRYERFRTGAYLARGSVAVRSSKD